MLTATYARVSTQGQAEHGYSLAEQRERLAAHCAAKGYELAEHIADEGVSGVLSQRPGLRRLLALAETGAVKKVVALNLGRLGRENRIVQTTLHRIRSFGVNVEWVEHGGGEEPEERLQENIHGSFSEYEWAQIRKRTMNGRRRKAEQTGRMPNGAAPYGFRAITRAQAAVIPEYAGRDGEYLIESSEAEIVKTLFRRYAGGESLHGLETWLREAGVKAPRGGDFTRKLIHDILKNPAYIGKPIYRRKDIRKTEGDDGRVHYKTNIRPAAEWIELACPAIVDEALFAAVGERLAENRERKRKNANDPWMLSGCVVCGHCLTKGRFGNHPFPRACIALRRHPGSPRYYQCSSRTVRDLEWCGVIARAEPLEQQVREALMQAAAPGVLAAAERARLKAAREVAGDPERQARAAEAELAKVEAEEAKLLELALAGFSQAVIDKKLADLQGRRRRAQEAFQGAREAVLTLEDPDQAAQRAEALAERLREALDDPDRLHELARQVVRVMLYRDQGPEIRIEVPAV